MHAQVDVGEAVVLRVECLNSAGDHADPVAIALTVTKPDGTTTVLAIGALTHVSTGIYTYSYTTTLNGMHEYLFDASGGGINLIADGYFLVGTPTDPGPCDDWITPTDVFAFKPASDIPVVDRDYGLAADCAEAATRILFLLSHRQYTGICKETVRPCRRCAGWWYPDGWAPYWGDCTCGASSWRSCGCPTIPEILLGGSPVLGISRIRIDGATLASTAYRVDDGRWLVRIDGQPWPTCQDLRADPATDDDTFDVTYYYGKIVPADGVLAAKRLAGDLYLGLVGSSECVIGGANVQQIVRQGVQYDFGDPSAQLAEALLNLREVDLFLVGERYGRSHRQTLTVSPDSLPTVRR